MFSVSPEIYSVVSDASRWLFAFFALMLLLFAFSWHRAGRKERKNRFKNLPEAGNVGEFLVLSGGDELPQNTWFPVPREGVLGSLRSCDLVVPCPGVRSQHLDFSWQDGAGLMIRPRMGCEVLVDGIPVTRRGAYADAPMRHGSLLQVGTAVLRLQLLAALSGTGRAFTPQPAVSGQEAGEWNSPPPAVPYPAPFPPAPGFAPQPFPGAPQPEQPPVPLRSAGEQLQQPPVPPQPAGEQPQQTPVPPQPAEEQPQPVASAPRRRRSDRWKEDWSE